MSNKNQELTLPGALDARKRELNNLIAVFNNIASPNKIQDLSPEQLGQNFLDYIDTRVATKLPMHAKLLLSPNFQNVVFSNAGLSNTNGNIVTEYDASVDRTYYQWSTAEATTQSKNIIVFCQVPEKYAGWSNYKFSCYVSGTASINIAIFDANNNQLISELVESPGWSDVIASPANLAALNNGTWTGEKFKIIFTMNAAGAGNVRISDVLLEYARGTDEMTQVDATVVNNLYTAIVIAQFEESGTLSTPTMFVDTFANLNSVVNSEQLLPFFNSDQHRFIIG